MGNVYKTGAISLLVALLVSIISGFVLIILSLTGATQTSSFNGLITAITIVSVILMGLYFYAFVYMGKKEHVPLLSTTAWIRFAIIILTSVLSISVLFGLITNPYFESAFGGYASLNQDQSAQEIPDFGELLRTFLPIHIIYSVIVGMTQIFFGMGLLKVKDRVKYAKPSGILEIIAGATLIIFIGSLITFVAQIFELIMLFSLSKKTSKLGSNMEESKITPKTKSL